MVYWVNKRSSCNIQTQVTLGKCDYTWNKEHQLPVNKYTERCYRCSAGVMIRHTLPETHDNKHTLQQRHRENRWATKEQWRVTWEQLWWCCPHAGSSQQPRPRSAAPVSSPGSSRWRPEPPCLPPCPGSCLKHRGQRSDSLRADVCVCVCACLTQAEGALVVLVSGSQLRHQLCAVVPSVISDDGGQLQHKHTQTERLMLI